MARVETGEQQPNPTSFRHALKEVIKNCIYGVDKNPLAVELCKVALWLESHNPGEPLSFLDHRIKCGDAIVGLAHREELQKGISNEVYQKLPGDEKDITSTFLKKNKQERILREKSGQVVQLTTSADHKLMEQVKELNRLIENFSTLPETTPEEIEKKEKAYRILINSESLKRLKILADLQIMPFFLPRTEKNKEFLVTDAQYHRYLRGEINIPADLEMKAIEISVAYSFFHWFLEFPEVFQKEGFDCILGNPPYLGGKKISGNHGDHYLAYLRKSYFPAGGLADLAVYFVRRDFVLINKSGYFSLIITNSISQGDSRTGGLEFILNEKGKIIHAIKSTPWPGKAAVQVALITLAKNKSLTKYILNNRKVNKISSFLDDEDEATYYKLAENNKGSFIGTVITGDGFILSKNERDLLINNDQKNNDIIKKFLIGDDLNSSPNQLPSRYVIDFQNWSLEKAEEYKQCIQIVREKVKPKRDLLNRESYRKRWWQFAERCANLYENISGKSTCLATSRVTKYLGFSLVNTDCIFSDAVVIINDDRLSKFSIIQSCLHLEWAQKLSSGLGNTIRYTPTDCYETFPFPENISNTMEQKLQKIGESLYKHRSNLMLITQLGLTKIYNAIHTKEISDKLLSIDLSFFDKKSIETEFGKEVCSLWAHLKKIGNSCSLKEAISGIIKLRELHIQMDNTVLEAYSWQDIDLRHYFYEVDNLPENDRLRFTIHPDARKEVLKRLLDLNHKIHEEEVKAGLWDKKTGTKKEGKEKSTGDQVNEPAEGYGGLFD